MAGDETDYDTTAQEAAAQLLDEFESHDQVGLAALDPAGLQAQLEARRVLYDYVDRLWEGAKQQGLNPAVRPEWSAVAGMRDLLMFLQATVWEHAAE